MASPEIRSLVINTVDPDELASFWSQLLDVAVLDHEPATDMIRLESRSTGALTLAFQRVPRVSGTSDTHLDIAVDDLDGTQVGIESSGGSVVKINKLASGFEWRVCADPHGNQFCIFVAH